MKRTLQKFQQADRICRNLFALIASVYLINISILSYYAAGSPMTSISSDWYWPQKFFLYSPIYCFFLSIMIGIISYWSICEALRYNENISNKKDIGSIRYKASRWMVSSSALFSIGITYFSIAFWIL